MMSQARIYGFTASAVICVLLLTAGCSDSTRETATTEIKSQDAPQIWVEPVETADAEVEREETTERSIKPEEIIKAEVEPEEQKPTVKLALKFTPEDLTAYKVTTETEQSVLWEGPETNRPKSFIGGHSGSRIEMTFTRRIQSVDGQGKAVAEITIKGLKYLTKVRDNIVLDFDSSREKDRNDPLCKLIGQSYTIEITASGEVSNVIDVSGALAAVEGSTSANQRAAQLLSTKVIEEQHSIPALPAAENNQLQTGGNWSNIKTFSFGPLGSKSYERIYELKEIKDADERRTAIVEMSVVPSSEKAMEMHKEQAIGFFSQMFDNPVETYTGQLKLDLTAGKIEQYFEEFRSEWVAVDQFTGKKNKEPDTLRMGAIRLYRFERID
ncbi:MAG TPA: hypothetical protein VMW72_22620 [Sedimentisphaerales bacterium]|nr:hypothetical protein [Sedimentisphaerales bacterium]